MHESYFVARLSILATVGLLGGCGGGSSTPPLTGAFVDAPVDGIGYTTTSGITGLTQNGGQFQYQPGDQVTFTIGGSAGLVLGTAAAGVVTTPLGFSTDPEAPEVKAAATVLQQLNDGTALGRITIPPAVNAFFANSQNGSLVAGLNHSNTDIAAFQAALSTALPSIITPANYTNSVAVLATASTITPDQALWNMKLNVNLLAAGQAFCSSAATDGYWVGAVTETVGASSDPVACAQDANGHERVLSISTDCSVTEQAFKDATLVDGGLTANGLVTPGNTGVVTYQGKYPDSTGTGNNRYTMTWSGSGGIADPIGSTVGVTGTWEKIVGTTRCAGTSTGTLTKSAQQLSRNPGAGSLPGIP